MYGQTLGPWLRALHENVLTLHPTTGLGGSLTRVYKIKIDLLNRARLNFFTVVVMVQEHGSSVSSASNANNMWNGLKQSSHTRIAIGNRHQ